MTTKIIDYDSQIFGFNVGVVECNGKFSGEIYQSITKWMAENNCKLVSLSLDADKVDDISSVQDWGFRLVDLGVTMIHPNISRAKEVVAGIQIREAYAAEYDKIANIAESTFEFGRYHRDHKFPKNLAISRFNSFIKDAFNSTSKKVFVSDMKDEIVSFMIVEFSQNTAQWQLGGVLPGESSAMLGPLFFSGIINQLKKEGVRGCNARISAANTSVLNLYAAFGFIARKPEYIFHYYL